MKKHRTTSLITAQEQAFQWLLTAIPAADVIVLRGRTDAGRSAVLGRVHAARGGTLLELRPFLRSIGSNRPQAIEDAALRAIEGALNADQLVIVDDLHIVTSTVSGDFEREYLFDAALTSILAEAAVARKKLVFGLDGEPPWAIQRRAFSTAIVD